MLYVNNSMINHYICKDTIDDLMKEVFELILLHGDRVKPSKGECIELIGLILEITNPRARLSRTETRGKAFSCLGELCWYLAESNELDFISYYISDYIHCADDNLIFGAYGPRLFDWKQLNQVENVSARLKENPYTRKAVIQLFDAIDIKEVHKDIPCTCTLQFLIRQDSLHMITYMRSNDAYLGLPHDIFSFTMLQEVIARSLSVELGIYKHIVGSLHLYDKHIDSAKQFISEGWQSTQNPMPPMPIGDPWPSIKVLLQAESAIRLGNSTNEKMLENLDEYWLDIIFLLKVFRYSKNNDAENITKLRSMMSSSTYLAYIDNIIRKLKV
jgi:thymidylate synthase